MGLINDIKTLNTRVKSSNILIKDALRNQNALIIDPDNMDTIPEEIDTLRILDHNPIDFFSSQIYDRSFEVDTNRIPGKIVLNKKTNKGIILTLITNTDHSSISSDDIYYQIDMNTDHPMTNRKTCQFPLNADNERYYYNPETTQIITVDKYFIIRFETEGIDIFSEDGITWNSDMSTILTNYKYIPGKYCAITDTTVALFSEDRHLYEYDFLNRQMIKNDAYAGLISPSVLSSKSFSASTDSIHFSITEKRVDDQIDTTLIYSSHQTPMEHHRLTLELGSEYTITKWVDMIASNRNTILLLGLTDTSQFIVYEVIMQYSELPSLSPVVVSHSTALLVKDTNTAINHKDSLVGKLIPRGYTYSIYTEGSSYIQNDKGVWTEYVVSEESKDSDIIADNFLVEYANQKLCRYSFKFGYLIERESIIKNTDVPEGKTFLSPSGTLSYGVASNSYYSLFSFGRICNLNLKENDFLNDAMLYDKRLDPNITFTDIVYYNSAYYFFLIKQNHIEILKSECGYTWEKVFVDYNFPLLTGNSGFDSQYKLIRIRGNLYLTRPGMNMVSVYCIRFDITRNSISYSEDHSICNYIPSNAIYLYYDRESAYYIEANETGYDFKCIQDSQIKDLNTQIEGVVSSIDYVDGYPTELLIHTSVSDYYIKDNQIYVADNKELVRNYYFRKVLRYDNLVIIIRESMTHTNGCILIYRLSEDSLTMSMCDSSIFEKSVYYLMTRKYYPLVTLKNNLLLIDDYQNINPAFVVDLGISTENESRIKLCRVEDSHMGNNAKYIQHCNGILFIINLLPKCESITANDSMSENGITDLAFADNKYIGICNGSSNTVYTVDGKEWICGPSYGENECDIVRALDNIVLVTKINEGTDIYYRSEDNGETWIENFYPNTWYVQNIEVEEDNAKGKQFIAFVKTNEDDPYNRVFYSIDGIDWVEITIDIVTSGIEISGWRDITCSDDGVWVAIAENKNIVSYSTDGVEWKTALLPRIQKWSGVCYGHGIFFAVASNSAYGAMSINGKDWEEVKMPAQRDWIGCAVSVYHDEPIFVSLAANCSYGAVGVSPRNLSEVYLNITTNDFVRVIYQDDKFVAIATNSAYAYYSKDGCYWFTSLLPERANWRYLLYGNGGFIVIDSTSSVCAVSVDGIRWRKEELNMGKPFRFIDHHNDRFVVFELNGNEYNPEDPLEFVGTSDIYKEWITSAFNGNQLVLASKDGAIVTMNLSNDDSWTIVEAPIDNDGNRESRIWLTREFPFASGWIGHAFNTAGIGVAIGSGSNSNRVAYTEDGGITWHDILIPEACIWTDIAYGNNGFALVSNDSKAYLSQNGKQWYYAPLAEDFHPKGLIGSNYRILAYGERDGKCAFQVTYDGIHWANIIYGSFDAVPLDHICANDKHYYITSNHHSIEISPNGLNSFTEISFDEDYDWKSIEIDPITGIMIIAVSNANYVLRSKNGIVWEKIPLAENMTYEWNKVIHINDRFILMGIDMNVALWSKDGISWNVFDLPFRGDWIDGFYVDNTYCLIMKDSGYYAYSYDCVYWYTLSNIDQLIYGNGTYLAIDKSDNVANIVTFLTSTDTLNWYIHRVPMNDHVVDIAYGNSRFELITAGESNFIYESIDGITWNKKYLPYGAEKSAIEYGSVGFVISEKNSNRVYLLENAIPSRTYKLPSSCHQTGLIFYKGYYYLFDANTRTINQISADMPMSKEVLALNSSGYSAPWLFTTISNVAILMYGSTMMYTSTDGIKWTVAKLSTNNINGILGEIYSSGDSYPVVFSRSSNTEYFKFKSSTGKWERNNLTFTDENDNKSICCGNSISVLIRGSIIYTLSSNGEVLGSYEVTDDDLNEVKYHNGRFIVTTVTNKYFLSYDGLNWYEYSLNTGFSITNIKVDGDLCVMILHSDSSRVMAYSIDDINWVYSDFDKNYGSDSDCTLVNQNLWILKYSDELEEILINLSYMALTASGTIETREKKIQPMRARFVKGSFHTNKANHITEINLGFTPMKVILRSRVDALHPKCHYKVLSSMKDIFNSMYDESNRSSEELLLDGDNTSFIDTQSMIITNGFIVVTEEDNTYFDYYAF